MFVHIPLGIIHSLILSQSLCNSLHTTFTIRRLSRFDAYQVGFRFWFVFCFSERLSGVNIRIISRTHRICKRIYNTTRSVNTSLLTYPQSIATRYYNIGVYLYYNIRYYCDVRRILFRSLSERSVYNRIIL